MESATRGSRRVFLPFREESPVQITINSPSLPIHTGTLCGEPSGMSVARCAKLGRSTSPLMSAESSIPINTPASNLSPQRQGFSSRKKLRETQIIALTHSDGAALPSIVVGQRQHFMLVRRRIAAHRFAVDVNR